MSMVSKASINALIGVQQKLLQERDGVCKVLWQRTASFSLYPQGMEWVIAVVRGEHH